MPVPLLPLALTGASFLPALFGGGADDKQLKGLMKDVEGSAATNKSNALAFGKEGSALTTPISKYLQDVIGGDRQTLLQATMPERRRVIDQYDTAKKSLTEFAPRGGGMAGALSEVNAAQASDLAEIGGKARTEGMDAAARLGVQLRQMGLSSQQLASMDLNTLIQTVMKRSEQSQETMMGLGESLGSIIGLSMLK